ncbi:MAG: DNA mismatch repair endonuclease MutL, partial [Bacteroidetes bacterium]|nr:DNA mismatch repair endonuclease MutL [Bacteroidota bacterium]
MSDIIQLLPENIANQIAAGEVIQRPASLVKELLENSIDSGASTIKLIVKDGGRSFIQVIDDGAGMTNTDLRLAFERHATSKISKIEDLFTIRTMGFRGEALASIAAIAHVEAKSSMDDDQLGSMVVIEGSEVKDQEQCQCSKGTSIAVKNLFYNVPARRNFLKSNSVETRHIIDEFQRVALANPEVSFYFDNNGAELFHLEASNLRKRIIGLFHKKYDEILVPAEETTDYIKISGYIGKPEAAKRTRGEQFFYVNNRFIKNAYLNHAVMTAYDEILPRGTYPFYILLLDIDPSRVDVNVHPSKQEIKFEDERFVYTIVHATIKHALGKYSVTPTLDFEQEQAIDRHTAFSRPVGNDGSKWEGLASAPAAGDKT